MIFLFLHKKYVVGTQRLGEVLLMSTTTYFRGEIRTYQYFLVE